MDLKKNNLKIYKIRIVSDVIAIILWIFLLSSFFFIEIFFPKSIYHYRDSSLIFFLYLLYFFAAIMYAIKIPYLIISQQKILLKKFWSKNIEFYKEEIVSIKISCYKLTLNIRNKKSISINLERFSYKDRYDIYELFQRISKERHINFS